MSLLAYEVNLLLLHLAQVTGGHLEEVGAMRPVPVVLARRYGGAHTRHFTLLSLKIHCLKVTDQLFEPLTYAAVLTILLDPFWTMVGSLRSLVFLNKASKFI